MHNLCVGCISHRETFFSMCTESKCVTEEAPDRSTVREDAVPSSWENGDEPQTVADRETKRGQGCGRGHQEEYAADWRHDKGEVSEPQHPGNDPEFDLAKSIRIQTTYQGYRLWY